MQLIVLAALKPRQPENNYYNSITEGEDPLFSTLGDDDTEADEEYPEDGDFAKLAEKVSSRVEEAKIFDDTGIGILLNYTLKLWL